MSPNDIYYCHIKYILTQVIWIKPEWQIIDPLCTFFFSILVLSYTTPLIKRIATVLLEGKPAHVSTVNERGTLHTEGSYIAETS